MLRVVETLRKHPNESLMNDTYQQLMRTATQLTREGRLTEATQLIQRALNGAAVAKDTVPTTTHADFIVDAATGPVTLDASATAPGALCSRSIRLRIPPP